MDEFAKGSSTENSAFGPTLNPGHHAHPRRLLGGSAAAVSAGEAFATLGSDTAARSQPAALCGVWE